MPDPGSKAVFLSYASQDASAAKRISEALGACGVEVWFDQSELRGGDAWDRRIRQQIRECALFIAIVSANTQARLEGYFRLEWKLAEDRSHLMAKGRPFILPVVVDGTGQGEAHVPDGFLAVQWSGAPGGEVAAGFQENILNILGRAAPQPSAAASTSLPPRGPVGKSVAVLAFANLSKDPENEFFSDGISEELLNVLARIPGLKVAARTSAFFFKGRNVPIPEIARTLGVNHVVEGSVRKSGNRVRITAQLIEAREGFHLWSDTFDRELQDIFAVQDEIAGVIAHNLQLKLGAAARAPAEVNPEAHRLVLEGRHFWTLRTTEGFSRAAKAFSRALEIDPEFAPAHSGLADVSTVRSWYMGLGSAEESKADLNIAAKEAKEALRLDPSLVSAYASLAVVAFLEHRWGDSEHLFQEALRLNPNYALAYHWRAHLLTALGRLDEGLADLDRSIALDPLSFTALVIYASQLNFARRYEDVLKITERASALRGSECAPLHSARAVALLALGRKAEAVAAARSVAHEESWWMRWWADEEALYVLTRAGEPEEAAKVLPRCRASLPPDSPAFGPLLQALGRFEEALPYLEMTAPSLFSRFYYGTLWDDVREDPRFAGLLAKLGCEAEYRAGRATLARILGGQTAEKSRSTP